MSSKGKLLAIPLTRSVHLQHCYEREEGLKKKRVTVKLWGLNASVLLVTRPTIGVNKPHHRLDI